MSTKFKYVSIIEIDKRVMVMHGKQQKKFQEVVKTDENDEKALMVSKRHDVVKLPEPMSDDRLEDWIKEQLDDDESKLNQKMDEAKEEIHDE